MRHSSMALISPTKKDDLEFLTTLADIIEVTFRFYKEHPTPETKAHLDYSIETYQELKHRIDTHDYTKDDASYWQLEALFKEPRLSPDSP